MCLYVGKHLSSVPFRVGHTGNPSFIDPLHWGHMWMVQIAQVFSLLSWHDYCITCGPRCARGSSSHPLISLFLPSLNVWVGFKDLWLVSSYPAITLACVHPVPSSFKWVFHHSLCVSTWCWGHFWNLSAYLIALELIYFIFYFFGFSVQVSLTPFTDLGWLVLIQASQRVVWERQVVLEATLCAHHLLSPLVAWSESVEFRGGMEDNLENWVCYRILDVMYLFLISHQKWLILADTILHLIQEK